MVRFGCIYCLLLSIQGNILTGDEWDNVQFTGQICFLIFSLSFLGNIYYLLLSLWVRFSSEWMIMFKLQAKFVSWFFPLHFLVIYIVYILHYHLQTTCCTVIYKLWNIRHKNQFCFMNQIIHIIFFNNAFTINFFYIQRQKNCCCIMEYVYCDCYYLGCCWESWHFFLLHDCSIFHYVKINLQITISTLLLLILFILKHICLFKMLK